VSLVNCSGVIIAESVLSGQTISYKGVSSQFIILRPDFFFILFLEDVKGGFLLEFVMING
jgi:hypothetical protein